VFDGFLRFLLSRTGLRSVRDNKNLKKQRHGAEEDREKHHRKEQENAQISEIIRSWTGPNLEPEQRKHEHKGNTENKKNFQPGWPKASTI